MSEMPLEGSEKEDLDSRRFRPPDRKKYEEELEVINGEIKARENHMKGLSPRGDDSVPNKLRDIRSEKNNLIQNRTDLDKHLKDVNREVTKRRENLARIETGLQYKNEDKINEAIRRLENQLKTTNYKLKEEKRIVAEIDRLNRSKKSLVQYNAEKKELDNLTDQQKKIREEKEKLFRIVAGMKKQEEQLKKNNQESREKSDIIKKELDELYEKKRALTSDFRKRDREYNEFRNELRKRKQEKYRQRREEERQQQQQIFQQELADYEASREPYEDEKQLCRTLSAYLQRYLVEGATDMPPSQESDPTGDYMPTDITEPEGMRVLKKKDDLDLFGGVKPKITKKKKEKKKAVNKVVHTPEVLAQFVQIGLLAPSCVNDVPTVIKQLGEKLEYYSSLPPPQKLTNELNGPNSEQGSHDTVHSDNGAPSLPESAISDSIPTTPEVHIDNGPPHFDPKDQDEAWPRPRRISRDSGTELEDSEDHNVNHSNPREQPDCKDRIVSTNIHKTIAVSNNVIEDLKALNLSPKSLQVNDEVTGCTELLHEGCEDDETQLNNSTNQDYTPLGLSDENNPLPEDTVMSEHKAVPFEQILS